MSKLELLEEIDDTFYKIFKITEDDLIIVHIHKILSGNRIVFLL